MAQSTNPYVVRVPNAVVEPWVHYSIMSQSTWGTPSATGSPLKKSGRGPGMRTRAAQFGIVVPPPARMPEYWTAGNKRLREPWQRREAKFEADDTSGWLEPAECRYMTTTSSMSNLQNTITGHEDRIGSSKMTRSISQPKPFARAPTAGLDHCTLNLDLSCKNGSILLISGLPSVKFAQASAGHEFLSNDSVQELFGGVRPSSFAPCRASARLPPIQKNGAMR